LSETFIHPALTALADSGVTIRFRHPLRTLSRSGGRVTELTFDDEIVHLSRHDAIVLAVPWHAAASLLPSLPDLPASPIVNAHFRLASPPSQLPAGGMLGLLGTDAQWLFLRGDILSVTVSAAAGLVDQTSDQIAERLWTDVSRALKLSSRPLAKRIIKEKRATLYHTPAVERLRPAPKIGTNLLLAGDWTATGLPCSLEGAILSGEHAAREILDLLPG
jgi:predicted NAD/FAD-dependent oxidoreductase